MSFFSLIDFEQVLRTIHINPSVLRTSFSIIYEFEEHEINEQGAMKYALNIDSY